MSLWSLPTPMYASHVQLHPSRSLFLCFKLCFNTLFFSLENKGVVYCINVAVLAHRLVDGRSLSISLQLVKFVTCASRLSEKDSLHRLSRYVTCIQIQWVFQALGFTWLSLAVHLCLGGGDRADPFLNTTRRRPAASFLFYSGHLVYSFDNILHVILTIILCITLNLKTVQH